MFEDCLTLDVTEEPVRARDVQPFSDVRPPFASGYWRALAVEPLGGPYVRILWDMASEAPHPYTVFEGSEWLATR